MGLVGATMAFSRMPPKLQEYPLWRSMGCGPNPRSVVLLIVVIRRLDQVFAVLIQKMHRAVFGIQQVEGVSLRDSGNSHRRVL